MLFCSKSEDYLAHAHVAEMIALLGPPPMVLLDRGTRTSHFFDEEGLIQRPDLVPANFNFEGEETCLKGNDQRLFLEFMRKMLRWLPEERWSARKLYDDPWLHTPTTA